MQPAIFLDNFYGRAAFIVPNFTRQDTPGVPAVQIGRENENTNVLILGAESDIASSFQRTSSGGNVGVRLYRVGTVQTQGGVVVSGQ